MKNIKNKIAICISVTFQISPASAHADDPELPSFDLANPKVVDSLNNLPSEQKRDLYQLQLVCKGVPNMISSVQEELNEELNKELLALSKQSASILEEKSVSTIVDALEKYGLPLNKELIPECIVEEQIEVAVQERLVKAAKRGQNDKFKHLLQVMLGSGYRIPEDILHHAINNKNIEIISIFEKNLVKSQPKNAFVIFRIF